MSSSVFAADLTWVDYDARVRSGKTVVFLPVGALEQHGPHMSMNPDVLIPTAISARVAERVGGLVVPAISYGYKSQQKSGGGNHMPGTTSLDGHTLTLTVRDILKELARHGVRRIVMMNGHFENSMFLVEGIDLAIRELRWDGIADFNVVLLSYWNFVLNDTIKAIYNDEFPGWDFEHGGVLETSLMLELYPQLVQMDKVADHQPPVFPPYDFFPIKPEWTPPSGTLSSAKAASAEKGRLLLQVCVDGISQAVSEAF
jgi:creatinine amidohydrolase